MGYPETECAEKEKVCVLPVSAVDALRWASGELNDVDLATRTPLVPEAVFLVNLPDRRSYRRMLELVQHWRQRGAVTLIARTGTPAVDRHLGEKNGCIRCFKEQTSPVKFRFLAPPEAFSRWCDKWTTSTPATTQTNAPTVKPEAIVEAK